MQASAKDIVRRHRRKNGQTIRESAPDILRFGFTPLFIDESEVDAAVSHLAQVLTTREWDQPQFLARKAVT